MIIDYAELAIELSEIATAHGLTLPVSIDVRDAAQFCRLSKLGGQAFDETYITGQLNVQNLAIIVLRMTRDMAAMPL